MGSAAHRPEQAAEAGRRRRTREYKAVAAGGFTVQIDEPEFSTSWMFYPDWSVEEYRKYLGFCVEVINHALEGVPEEQVLSLIHI